MATSSSSLFDPEQLRRWRLILGKESQASLEAMGPGACLSGMDAEMDQALSAIYDETGDLESGSGQRSAGLGGSAPRLAKWLGDIRAYFKEDVVSVIQADAIERKGLKQLLFEPEMLKSVQPNVQLVGTLMSLRGRIPERSKETARMVVRAVVEEIKKKFEQSIRQAVMGALNRKEHTPMPSASAIDWKWTIGRNLKNYNPDLATIIPERVYFYSRARKSNAWTVIVDMDQSGSMADSVVYGAVTGSIFASLPALDTHVIAFDTEVVDLTEQCGNDPVEMLFGVQLGGGTNINKSVAYCEQFINEPKKTILLLITDLFEGGNEAQLVRRLGEMVASGVKVICLLALSDSGVPSYDERLARKLSALKIPCFGCTPNRLPELIDAALRGGDLTKLATSSTISKQ
ncbi:VWA containing CoxE family protein [Isosphaera pallida ATCC 43644]|uniref:VWA containing CoxE family protein n=1 Tax=Isosphaera pallida (strain ATCC 43644 / DSM 9630 / IS1B) TaxID=575540 RepID=E8R311_ISOPI|nr:VWA domain-containing protein [Isosphaera pallida]ADV61515.1 VWA containing CoxE family protein [Isosphaera pallida ATCC 43644]